MARLDAVKRDETAPSVIFQRLTDPDAPERLSDIAKAWGLPRGRFVEWFTTEHAELYDSALRVLAGEMVLDALKESDDARRETVDVAKLKINTRLQVAGFFDRKRYGTAKDAAVQVNIGEFAMRPTEQLVESLERLIERGGAKQSGTEQG